MPIQSIEPRRLYRQIADQIRTLIRSGEFPPGSRLPPERDLESQLDISRTSLRQALSALTESGLNNNLYVQIGLVLLMALSAKNAILIVEFARELRAAGRPILDAATEAARARFRPIVMTSLAFILGVVPLVLASGAGASARVSIGMTVFTGMIASTCLAVLFVPPFFAVMQRFEEWRKARRGLSPADRPAE